MRTSDLTLWSLRNSATSCCSLTLKSPKGSGQLQLKFQSQLQLRYPTCPTFTASSERMEKKRLPFYMLIFWDFELKIWVKRKRHCALQFFLTHTKTKGLLTGGLFHSMVYTSWWKAACAPIVYSSCITQVLSSTNKKRESRKGAHMRR